MSFDAAFAELTRLGLLKKAHHFDEVDSTNSAARRFAEVSFENLPALFVADRQTQGRGRGGHIWWSPQGCLMMTLAINCHAMPSRRELWSQLALLVGVSAAEAIESLFPQLDIQLKWPNDLYLSGRKLGGILIESFSSLPSETAFAIGIGINVQMDWKAAPPEVAQRATCLSSQSGQSVQIDELLLELITVLSTRLRDWGQFPDAWFDAWHPRCLLSGKIVTIDRLTGNTLPNQRLTGRCEGVASDGCLLVRIESGGVVAVNAGEVVNWQS